MDVCSLCELAGGSACLFSVFPFACSICLLLSFIVSASLLLQKNVHKGTHIVGPFLHCGLAYLVHA